MSDYNRTAAMSGLLAGNETLAKVSDVEYSKVQSYFEMLEAVSAVSRLTYQSIYVMDYCKMNFLYVSDNPIFLCGRTREEVMAMGFDFLLEQCKPEEVHALIEINRASLISVRPVSENGGWSTTSVLPSLFRTPESCGWSSALCPGPRMTQCSGPLSPARSPPRSGSMTSSPWPGMRVSGRRSLISRSRCWSFQTEVIP